MQTFTAYATQFLRPDGRRKQVSGELPIEAQEDYKNMIEAKCELHMEVLTTGHVSITISDGEDDIDRMLTYNGQEVQAAIVKMLNRRTWLQPRTDENAE